MFSTSDLNSFQTPNGVPGKDNQQSHWYAVYTIPRHEKKVAQQFEQRGIPGFLPLYRAQHRWKDGTKAKLELPLFPNYMFACIPYVQRVRVLAVPGVISLVGNGAFPVPISGGEIESLRAGIREYRVEPHPYLTVGKRVRICSGAMAGLEGIIARKKNEFRVVLSLDRIMQSFAIEIDATCLEPIPARTPGFQLMH